MSGSERGAGEERRSGVGTAETPGWQTLARREAADAFHSTYLAILTVVTALLAALAAVVISPLYTRGLEGALGFVEEIESPLEEVLEQRELDALELVLGPNPTVGDVQALLESLLSTGDVFATLMLMLFAVGFGPVLGIVVTVPAILDRRESGRFRELLESGYERQEIVVGTFLGRFSAAAAAMAVVAVAIGLAVGARVGSVSGTYVVVALTAVLGVAVYAAFGTMIATVAGQRLTAWVGCLGLVIANTYLTATSPFRSVTVAFDDPRNQLLDVVIAPPGDALPGILQRFHPYNVVADGTHLVALSDTVEAFPRVSYVALPRVLDGEAPPPEAVESLPFYMQHWFVYAAIAVWIAVPLVVATKRFDADVE